jgi:nucleotide-binding universal stress UspA family protein
MKILIAVDGSKASLDAVQNLAEHIGWYRGKPEVVVVTVHLPVPKLPRMGMAVGKAQIQKYYEQEGEARLAPARRKLEAAGIACETAVLVGPIAESIVKHAKDKRCDLIYIGTRGMTEIGKAMIGSTATKVLHISDIPVLLVK